VADRRTAETVAGLALTKKSFEEVAAFLDEACAGEADLRKQVEAILEARRSAGSPPGLGADRAAPSASGLAGALANLQAAATRDVDPLPSPAHGVILEGNAKVIGHYKLLQQIGEGGFGVVYMAEQQEPVQRKVALKIIKPGMDSREVMARFEAERQALALMDHPNIARVLDGGSSDGGRPYFVMELVKGMPITDYCDKNSCSTRDRLELFVAVCRAVQHAHQKGVIHRDLKPSNIMVTLHDGKPVPKVIDFGVAKALSLQLTERTLFTAYGQMIGTPAYMSPEQAEMSGLDVDTRSDIYSLGVLLYELLTGSTPLDAGRLRGTSYAEVQRMICEEEPPRPSTKLSTLVEERAVVAKCRGTDPERLRREIAGDLDWIVMRALEKDRNVRYDTADAFSADVERHLRDEPVEARPPTASYKLRKFARKHRRLLATVSAFAVLLVLAAVASTSLAIRARSAERHAKLRYDEAQSATTKLHEAHARLQANQEELRHTLYAVRSNFIQAAWDSDNVARVLDLLEEQRPGPGEEDLRGFEWHYWKRRCHADLRTVRLERLSGKTTREMAFSPDAKRLAAVVPIRRDRAELRVWDAVTGGELLVIAITGMSNSLSSLVFGGNGARIAAASWAFSGPGTAPEPSELRVWDVASGREIFAARETSRSFTSITLSPDSSRLAATLQGSNLQDPSPVTEVKVWDVASREPLLAFSASGSISSLRFSPDGSRIAGVVEVSRRDVLTPNSRLQVWDATSGKETLTLKEEANSYFSNVAFSPDGRRLAASSTRFGEPGRIKMWDAATGEEVLAIHENADRGGALAFSPDGTRLAGLMRNATVKIWDAVMGRTRLILKGHTGPVGSVVFSPDGRRLYSAASDGTVKVWDASGGDELPVAERAPSFGRPAISPDLTRIAVDEEGGESGIRVMDFAGKDLYRFSLPKGHSHELTFSRDGGRIAAVWHLESQVYELKVWDLATGVELFTIREEVGGSLSGLAFSRDGTRIASAVSRKDGDSPGVGQLKLWNAATGKEIRVLHSVSGASLGDVAFSPDGERIAAILSTEAGGDQADLEAQVKVWEASSGQDLLSIQSRMRDCHDLTFSPDGKRLAVASEGFWQPGEVRAWDAISGREILQLKGHSGRISDLVFSPDGRRVATAADSARDQAFEIKLWDSASGQELLTLARGGDWVGGTLRLAFSPDGARLLAAGGSRSKKTHEVWDGAPLPAEEAASGLPR
jgi:WD40 repeat protein/serine/threonine protein kinase